MFLSRNKKNNVYPCKSQFYSIKVGFKGVKIIKACFRDEQKDVPCRSISNEYIHNISFCVETETYKYISVENMPCLVIYHMFFSDSGFENN